MMATDRLQGRKTLKVGNFLDEFEKDDVKKKVDIVTLFESFGVKLAKKGKSHVGKCPWHDDANPSLSVDRAKSVYNCFGCGESGDIFTLTEKMKGFDFKEALSYLKNEYRVMSNELREKIHEEKIPDLGEVLDTHNSAPVTLTTIADYYHKKLYENPQALEYLHKRGLENIQSYDRFNIGFADGSLLNIIGESQRKELTEIGILTDRGHEHFRNCITFSIVDELGQAVGMYGRNIDDRAKTKHLYLKGKHRSIFNRKASKVFDEVILTESIIDALSLVEMGIENVQAIYGTNGFTDEHLQILKDDRVKAVVLALDNDDAGKAATGTLKERFISEGYAVKVIFPPREKDWSDYLVLGGSADSIKETIVKAEIAKNDLASVSNSLVAGDVATQSGTCASGADSRGSEAPPAGQVSTGVNVSKDAHAYTFVMGECAYRVTGVKELFIGTLRVNIRASVRRGPDTADENERYYDNLDLYSARSRTAYCMNLARIFRLDPKRIEKDVIAILEYLETERDRKLLSPASPEKDELTKEEIDLGMSLLASPRLFDDIVKDMETLGYVGEDLNKKLLYLAASSRVLVDPISVLILSQSAAGKSMLVDTVKKLIPADEVIAVTSLSDQALNYVSNLMHKFLVLGEAVHAEVIEHQIREMLSGHELSRLVTVKDEKTGKMTSKEVKTPAVVSAVMSGTSHAINPENASRCFIVNSDESREQTRRIHALQREKYSLKRVREKRELVPEIVRKHHAAQKLLRRVTIINPFAKYLDFPDALMRTRRDHDRFIDLIACVAFLRQYQKETKENGNLSYIECDLTDYEIAYEIMVNGVLSATMTELPKGALELYESLRDMAGTLGKKKNLRPNEASFTQREIREHTGYGQSWIKQHLRILVDFEYVVVVKGGNERARGFYRLREDEPIARLDLSVIPSPAAMRERIAGVTKECKIENDV